MMAANFPVPALGELKRNWGWFLALGVTLIVLGSLALGSTVVVTLLSVTFLGRLLIIGGALQAAHGFMHRAWQGFFVDIAIGLLYIVVGSMFIDNPLATAEALTLMMAVFLILGGALRLVAAFSTELQHRIWLLPWG